jgi:hypothetical protein
MAGPPAVGVHFAVWQSIVVMVVTAVSASGWTGRAFLLTGGRC